MPITVYLVDDHRILCDGLRMPLELQGDIHVIGEADDGRKALEGFLAAMPDVVLMDITMPGLNGIDATRNIMLKLPHTNIIILSAHSDTKHIYRALQAGAKGYLLKESAGDEVVRAVHAVYQDKQYSQPELVLIRSYVMHLWESVQIALRALTINKYGLCRHNV